MFSRYNNRITTLTFYIQLCLILIQYELYFSLFYFEILKKQTSMYILLNVHAVDVKGPYPTPRGQSVEFW